MAKEPRKDGYPASRSTREQILLAALQELRSTRYSWHRGLTIGRIADRAEVSEETVYNIFKTKDALLAELVDVALLPGPPDIDSRWDIDAFATLLSIADDEAKGLNEVFGSIAETAVDLQVNDPSMRSHMLLWSQIEHDSRIRDAVAASYRQWDDTLASVARTYFEEARHYGGRQRIGMEAEDLAIVLGALSEGLALRAKAYGDEFPPGLARRAVLCLLSALIAFDDDTDPVDDLGQLSRRRAEWLAGCDQINGGP